MSIEGNVQTLRGLGFTVNQAKVYLALVATEFSTVKEIQKISRVPRQEIYKIILVLQDMGLVERTLTRPVKFRTIPLQQGVSFLLKQRTQETKRLQQEAEQMVQKINHKFNNHKVQESLPHFVLISRKEASISKTQEEIGNAQERIDFITSWKKFPLTLYIFGETAEKALERNVKVRAILEQPVDSSKVPEELSVFNRFANFELRYIPSPPETVMAIFDKKKAIVDTYPSAGLAEAPSLWTDNSCLLAVFSDYFEIMWITAMENRPETIINKKRRPTSLDSVLATKSD